MTDVPSWADGLSYLDAQYILNQAEPSQADTYFFEEEGEMGKVKGRNAGFYITGKKGFHIQFVNGWTISVQFGPGNYCNNYPLDIGEDDEKAGERGSPDAECAVWGGDGKMIQLPGWNDNVHGNMVPADVLELLVWAAEQEEISND